MFTGNWGISINMYLNMPVRDLIADSLPRTFDLFFLPLLIGIVLGILLGKLSMRTKHKWIEKLIQVLTLIGLAVPIFSLCMIFQYILGYLFPLFPITGYKTTTYPDPPLVTGFRIIDSLLSKENSLIFDYIHHLILPWIILTIGIIFLTTFLVRQYLMNKSNSRSIVPNSFIIVITFSIIFTYLVFIESIFKLDGIVQLLYVAIRNVDYCVIETILFLILMIAAVLITIGNFILIGYRAFKIKHVPSNLSADKKINEDASNFKQKKAMHIFTSRNEENGFKTKLKQFQKYFNKKLISPFTIAGSAILFLLISLAVFSNWISPFTVKNANGVFPGYWDPPSPLHPLGQTKFGRDVLARIIYGTRTSLLFVLLPTVIGLIGGLVCGIAMSYLNRRFKISTHVSIIIFFICPMALFIMLINIINSFLIQDLTGSYSNLFMSINYGLLLIPFFALLIAKTTLNGFKIMKKITPYIPLLMGFILLFQSGIAFLDLYDSKIISLGGDINGVLNLSEPAFHAFIFHTIALSLLTMGFFLLYIGLQKTSYEN